MGPRLMSTGMSSIEMGILGASYHCQLRTVDHCRGRDTQQRSPSPPSHIVHLCGCVFILFYFSTYQLEVSSEGFFEGLIYAQDLGLRLTLEEGLS